MRKRRFSFWKLSLWLTGINIILLGLMLIMIFYVKLPGPQVITPSTFHLSGWLARSGIALAFQCFFYYISLNGFYRLMERRAPWQWYVGLSILYLSINCLFSFLAMTILPKTMKLPFEVSALIFSYGLSAVFHVAIALIVATIFRQFDEKRSHAENQKLLEQRALKLEKEKMQADYSFLKAQINPHFLHNTLNFLYARSLPYSPELSEGILTLSQIMRYSLDNHEDGDGKVLLTHEIGHVHNIIRMQQLRFDNSLQVQFTLNGSPDGRRILPFVLITLVENAFKHGDLRNTDHPVKIGLNITHEGQMHFTCSNKKKTGPKELSTGIGLDNTRKRLELSYGENYSLYIKDQRELFTVDLTIKL